MTVYIGIDWSENKHDICFMNSAGEVLITLKVKHDVEGFVAFNKARLDLGVKAEMCIIGLETAHNLVVDYLWEQGYEQIYILPPNAVKSAQGRFRQSGAKDDTWDARLIADMLRTDQHRYSTWCPDSPLTRQIRSAVGMIHNLNKEMVRNSNRLRAILVRYYPVALDLFSSLDGLVTLAFIRTYPTPQDAAQLTFDDLKVFLRQHHHTQPKKWARCYAQLQQPYPIPDPAIVTAYAPQAVSYAKILEIFVQQKALWMRELSTLYQHHPDREIYASLPGAGAFLEPALLSKLGDDRNRFPSPEVLQAIAGTCPVTQRSGKRRVVHFRRACDHQFRQIMQQWAKLTLDASPWAVAYYRSVLPQCCSSNDAVRRLANRWLEILWRLWQDRKPYDQTHHLRQHAIRCQPK
jgi:transposase